jgi:hypothetical protein
MAASGSARVALIVVARREAARPTVTPRSRPAQRDERAGFLRTPKSALVHGAILEIAWRSDPRADTRAGPKAPLARASRAAR